LTVFENENEFKLLTLVEPGSKLPTWDHKSARHRIKCGDMEVFFGVNRVYIAGT